LRQRRPLTAPRSYAKWSECLTLATGSDGTVQARRQLDGSNSHRAWRRKETVMATYGKKAQSKVKKVMEERKKGTLKSGPARR
jgi:hypothetical protein